MKFSERYNLERIPAIYGIKNIVTNRWYIGSCLDVNDRTKRHYTNLKHNTHHSIKLQESWNKYGEDSFEIFILRRLSPDETVDSYNIENEFMDSYDSLNNGYNSIRANKGHGRFKQSDEAKRKAGDTRKLKIVCINRFTGKLYKIYGSVTEAAEDLNMETTNICCVCKKKRGARYLGDYTFRYIDDYDENENYITYHYMKGVPKSDDWKRKARLHSARAKKVYMYDMEGNLINTYVSRFEAERQHNMKKEFLRCRMDREIDGFIFTHKQR